MKQKWIAALICMLIALISACAPEDREFWQDVAEAIETYNIAFIGDSYASGEGNPDGRQDQGPLWWSFRQCHRSTYNGRFDAIERLDNSTDDLFAIEFIDVACSGATIDIGLLGAYRGIFTPNVVNDPLDPQVDQVKRWVDRTPSKKLDALVITIGGNDVGFGKVVSKCLTGIEAPCNEHFDLNNLLAFGDPEGPGAIGFNNLDEAYARLDRRIRETFEPDPTIILVGYPDPLRNEDEEFCDQFNDRYAVRPNLSGELQPTTVIEHYLPLNAQIKFITKDESEWLFNNLVHRLNGTMESNAEELGWHFVGGLEELTRRHGYCSRQSWFNTLKDSDIRQGDYNGTAHPNNLGFLAYRETIVKALVEILDMGKSPAPYVLGDPFLTHLLNGNVEANYKDNEGYPGNTVRLRATLLPTAATIESVRIEFSFNHPTAEAFTPNNIRFMEANNDVGFSYESIFFADIENRNLRACDWVHYRWRVTYLFNNQQGSTTSNAQSYRIINPPGTELHPICDRVP